MTRAEVIQQLARDLVADVPPLLSVDDIESIADASARYGVAAVGTAYSIGQRVVPTLWNGRVYEVVVAGTTAANAPTFPTVYGCTGQAIVDGTVTWRDVGVAHRERYDLRKALRDGCRLKARRVAHMVSIANGPDRLNLEQQYQHWDAEAKRMSGFFAV